MEDVAGTESVSFTDAEADNVDFAYDEEQMLKDYSIKIPKGKVVASTEPAGSGKSTLLKLLMRFWDVQGGQVKLSGRDVRGINTSDLREMEAYVTQETVLFHDSIANNIAIGKDRRVKGRDHGGRKESVHPRLYHDAARKGMTQKSESWVIRYPAERNRDRDRQGVPA